LLNNKSALAYIDGLAFFIDMTRVNVEQMRFDKIRDDLDHPIFILKPKRMDYPLSSTAREDYIKLLFDGETEDLLIEVVDKCFLNEIANTIEACLQSVRKKIETSVPEANAHIREQISMLTRTRSYSGSSMSSSSSSKTAPLQFYGHQLKKAPEPGLDTPLMEEFNRLFSMRMQRLCAIIKSNSLGLRPLDGYQNKFYIYRWDLLLQSLEDDLIYIWQVRFISESSKTFFMLALTDVNEPPEVEEGFDAINIKTLALNDSMTELTRMILLRTENVKTMHMTVLLYGCEKYFRICGVLNSKENYLDGFVAKPTRQTHPQLTAKIQKVYNIWYGMKKRKQNEGKKVNQLMETSEVTKTTPTPATAQKTVGVENRQLYHMRSSRRGATRQIPGTLPTRDSRVPRAKFIKKLPNQA
jgi:hypothetical protein